MMKSILFASALITAPFLTACSGAVDNTASAETVAALSSQLPELSGEHVWSVDRSQSKLEFLAEHNGDKFTGNFAAFEAAVKLDLDNPESGEIHAVIDLSSIDAKDDDRNANLPTKAWFDMTSFPLASYSTSDISGSKAEGFTANGILSIKGIERPVELSFTVNEDGNTAKANGTARFSRMDFDIGTGSDFETEEWVKFPIEVLVSITATR